MASTCPFSYAGSKSEYPELHRITEPVVDLFGGGGGFWSNVASTQIFVNEISRPLVRLQAMIYSASDEQYAELVSKIYAETAGVDSRESYEALRARFNASDNNPVLYYAVLSCCTNNLVRFNKSGGFNQTWGQRKFNPNIEKKLNAFRERIKKKSIAFKVGSFDKVIEYDMHFEPPTTTSPLYFADPPYLITNGGYNTSWTVDDENRLYDFLAKRRFVLTNFIRRGALVNAILERRVAEHGWLTAPIRSGKMKAQRDQADTYEELVVTNDQGVMDLILNK